MTRAAYRVKWGTQTHRLLQVLPALQPVTRDPLRDALLQAYPQEPNRWYGINDVLGSALERGLVDVDARERWCITDTGSAELQRLAEEGSPPERPPAETPAQDADDAPKDDASAELTEFLRLATAPLRAGADAHRQHPSRMGDRLIYPDGRVTDLNGLPLPRFVSHAPITGARA